MARRTPRLIAPESFRRANRRVRARYCNGCGGAGSWTSWAVPNQIDGICVRPACNVHDWMYGHGKRKRDKFKADMVFLRNLLTLCHTTKCSTPRFVWRGLRCFVYFAAVTLFGSRYYGRKVASREQARRAA